MITVTWGGYVFDVDAIIESGDGRGLGQDIDIERLSHAVQDLCNFT